VVPLPAVGYGARVGPAGLDAVETGATGALELVYATGAGVLLETETGATDALEQAAPEHEVTTEE